MSEKNPSFPENTSDASLSSATQTEKLSLGKRLFGPDFRFVGAVFDYVEIIVFSVCVVLILFMLCGRLCRVNGNSMLKTLHDGELLITTSIGDIEYGDIVVFHQTGNLTEPIEDRRANSSVLNEPLVKRIIGVGGDTIRIDHTTSKVYRNGEELDEPYAALLSSRQPTASGWGYVDIGHLTQRPGYNYDPATRIFEVTVPEGCFFVMGDNRNNSADSRTVEVGCVDARRMLGRVVVRVKPFTTFD